MHRIVVSSSAAQRLSEAAGFLEVAAGHGPVLIVAAHRGAADDLVWNLTRQRRGWIGLQRFTPMQLAAHIAAPRLAEAGSTPLTRLGGDALAARSVFAALLAGSLRYFEPVARTFGFARALAGTLRELRLHGVTGSDLRSHGESAGDLADLLDRYVELLDTGRLSDTTHLLEQATVVLNATPGAIGSPPVLWLDVLPSTPFEARFIRAVAAASPDSLATLPPGQLRCRQMMEAALRTTALELGAGESTALDRLRSRIFTTGPLPPAEPDETFTFFSAADEGRECVEIARRIHHAAGAGTPFDQIAVLLRSAGTYQPLIEDALRRSGIPGYFTHGSIRPNPSGRAFLALLTCAAESLSATRFAEYLSLGQTPDAPEPAREPAVWIPVQGELFAAAGPESATELPEPPASRFSLEEDAVIDGSLRAPFRWEGLLVEAAVVGGRDRWERRLRGLRQELIRQADEAERTGDARRDYLIRQIHMLGFLERFALPLIARLDHLPAGDAWSAWIDALDELAIAGLRQPDSVRSVLAELRPMAEVGPVSLPEVIEVLTPRLTSLRSEPAGRRHGKVFVGTIDEAAGRAFDLVFLPGLAEGSFPKKSGEDPMLLDEVRPLLLQELPVEDDRLAAERVLLHIAAGAARRYIVVSYPRTDIVQGRPKVPSFYALDVLRAAEGRIPDLRELERRAAGASESIVGWPAPREAGHAIDDAEYDLSVIARWMRAGAGQADARAAYLLTANECLARSLRSRHQRWGKQWYPVDGLLGTDVDGTTAALEPHRLDARPYSATALQSYAACPYRFLLQAIHGLRPRASAVPVERLDPLTRGSLFHAVQFRLLSRLRQQERLPFTAAALPTLLDDADDALNTVAAEYREELAPAIDRIWETEIEDIRTDLRGWIRSVVSAPDGWTPRHFELSFGLKAREDRDPASTDTVVCLESGERLRGSVDLIEADEAGNLRITDHKTGRAPKERISGTGNGETLQPLLYALAVEHVLDRPVRQARLFYCTRRGDFATSGIEVDDAGRNGIRHVLRIIDDAVRHGLFPAAPRPAACEYCDYRIVCGPYEETRTGRKRLDDERLDALNELRSIP